MTMPSAISLPRIESFKKMKRLMTLYYFYAKWGRWLGKKVAWVTSGAPVEILYLFDVIPIYPENHGAICGASKMGRELCEIAESLGYSKDLCSYAKCDLAALHSGKSPIGGLPRPDLLLCCNNICTTVLKWYEILADYFQVPLYIIDTPFVSSQAKPYQVQYTKKQLERFIAGLEKATRRDFKDAKFARVVRLSAEALQLWQKIIALSKHIPSPLSCFDAFIHMAPIVTLRGTTWAIKYYQTLYTEIEKRVQKGISAVPSEQYRILWDNIPVWYKLSFLSKKFASLGASLVVDTYSTAWSLQDLSLSPDLESLAQAYTTIYLNVGLGQKVDRIKSLCQDYAIDGVVFHSNRSCKPYSFGQYAIQRTLSRDLEMPSIILEADMVDQRFFTEQRIVTQIEAFVELLRERK